MILLAKQTNKNTEFYLQDGNKRKKIGFLVGDKFYKVVRKSEHLFRVLDAWGLDAKLVNKVLLPKKCDIIIIDEEEGLVYEKNVEDFVKEAVYFHFKNKGLDYGSQMFLPRDKWSCQKINKENFYVAF